MSNRHHHQQQYKPSSHSRTTNPLTARTVIYDETSPNPSLKSSVRQVVETTTTSFYNTNPTSNPSLLTIGSGKRSRPINSEMYHSEIVDDVEDDDDEEEGEEEEGEMDYLPTHHRQQQIGQKIEKKNRRTHGRSSSDDRSKRRRHSSSGDDDRRHHHHHRSPPSVEVIENDDAEQPSKHKRKKQQQQQRRRRDSSKEEQSPSEEGEEGESISGVSDDRHSKDEHQSGTTNEEEKDQKPERIHSSSDDHSRHEQEDGEDVEPPPPAPDAYHRSRFDDHDDDEEEENDRDRHRHRTHKRSRRRSSSTSSTSTSTGTPPLPPPPTTEPEPEIEVTNAHLDATPIPQPTLPIYYPAIQGCRRVDEYQCLNRIEEGTYGVVFRARETKTGEIVALKRLKMEKEKEGFPITSLREICCILKSQHENVVTVREIVVGNDMNRIYIVMDYVEHDLKSLMTYTMKKPFSTGEIKTLMLQLLSGINHLHDNWIIHRDLKTSNLLLSNKGILKIGDFGLAREYGSPLKPYTPVVVTLWYRAPELLLGIKEYATSIDIWSVGAIFGELLLMKPLFPGKSELDQLNRIFKDLGTPNEKIWPEYNTLPFTKKMNFTHYPYNRLRTRFDVTLSEQGFDLINKFLTYDPTKRISAQEALKHGFFSESPRPIDPSMFPTWPSRNEEKDKLARGGALGAGGSSATAAQNEPKPPSGGKMYEKLLGAEDDNYPMEQSLPPPIGFQLRG